MSIYQYPQNNVVKGIKKKIGIRMFKKLRKIANRIKQNKIEVSNKDKQLLEKFKNIINN
jgi:argonaute-like protein implicated in RNA metabolism and viral defense